MPKLLPERFATECINEFELAALERFADANQLVRSGRRTGAIYVYGYVVEMLLKSAYFRILGSSDMQVLTIADLRLAIGETPASMANQLGSRTARNFHDLLAWMELILAYRKANLIPHADTRFTELLRVHVEATASLWSESMRYHKNTAYPHEVGRVRESCEWVVENRDLL